jgi:hypothetical protein
VRDGRRALVTYAWAGGDVDIAVTVEGETVAERLTFWPFAHATLLTELEAVGLTLEQSTWEPEAARYLVIARTGL